MKDLSFKRDDLLARIRENRDAHRGTFEDGVEGYRLEMLRRVERVAHQLEKGHNDVSGELFDAYSQPRPEDHTGEYDAIIDMLTMTEEETITLTYVDFTRFVRDEWPWKREFVGTVANYR